MTRHQFRSLWLIVAICLLFASTFVHGGAANLLMRLSLADLGGLLFWEWRKDK